MITHEEDWLEKFKDLLKQAENIPICSAEFFILTGYLKVILEKFLADQKYS